VDEEVDGERVARVLEDALALMNDSGAHWVQGEYMVSNGEEMFFCSVGAIRKASGHSPFDMSDPPLTAAAIRAVASAYRSIDKNDPGRYRVIKWNDNPKTTWDTVVRRFGRAAAKARKET
jgi:hypothetical protein